MYHGTDLRDSDPDDARRLIGEIDRLQSDTRSRLAREDWQTLAVWGLVCAGAVLSAFTPLAGWYWLIGVPVGLLGTLFLERKGHEAVARSSTPYWLIGAGIGALNSIAGILFPPEFIVVSMWVVLALGFAAMCLIERRAMPTGLLVGVAVLASGAAVVGVNPFDIYALAGSAVAAILLYASWSIRAEAGRR